MAVADFVHLRVRSAYSLLEGAIKPYDLAGLSLANDMPAVGLSDRANLFGALEISQILKDKGVQPLIGCALPVSGIGARGEERWARAPTIALIAKSEAGWLNLMALSSHAFVSSSMETEACVAWEDVVARSEGLILLSGGPDGPINPLFGSGREAEGFAALAQMQAVFGDRFYVELQRHGLAHEAAAEPFLVRYAYEYGAPLVATNDVYFSTAQMHSPHDALLCISDSAFLGQDERRRVTVEHRFKTAAEMRETFADLPEACDNTIEIARRCAFLVSKRDPILPSFPTGQGRTEVEELAHQAREGLKQRLQGRELAAPQEEYDARLERELSVIGTMGFPGYFLIVSDFIKWAKAHGIPVGPGRGSGAGSLVAYALTITNLDPLRFGLLFERFLNPERVSMPDFDIDFCQERREEVISYVQQRYGVDRVAQIITFGTLQARAVLRDVGRVMQLPLGMVDRLAKMVPNNPANPVTLAQAIELEPRLKEARRDDDSVARLLETALHLEGLFRNASTHAAGVVLDRALKHLARRGAAVDLDSLALDDQATYALLASGQTIGVFQLESQGMRDTLRKLRCSTIEEITALISLYRPGPMDNIDTYVDRKFGRAALDMLHPSLEPILKETYGVIIYQEQVMQIAQVLSGYSLGEADLLRRAMGKKKKEEMDFQKARFVAGASERGVDPAQADFIFELVAKFAGYGFNKSHAAAYAMIAYQTGWLKANQPVEFFAASMSLDISNTDKLAVFYQDAKRFGVSVSPPDINRSGADFDVEDGCVLYALGAVRNVGVEAVRHVTEVRAAGGPYADLFDFVERIDPRILNKRALENLARAGAFDRIHPNRAQILAASDVLMGHAQSLSADRAAAQESLFGDSSVVRPRLPAVEPWTGPEQLDEELAAVGFYLTGHPLEDMGEVMRRKRVVLAAEAVERAEAGDTAFRMAGVVRRRQERPSQSGEKFAYATLSDPTGEFEVMVLPEALRRHRDLLEPGKAVMIKIRAKLREGEVRFYADDVELMDKAMENAVSGMRVHVTPDPAVLIGVRRRLDAARSERGGELILVAGLGAGREVEVKLPGRFSLDASVRGALKSVAGVVHLEDV